MSDLAAVVREDPKKAGAQLVSAGVDFVKSKSLTLLRAQAGETRSIAEVEAAVTELGLDFLAGTGTVAGGKRAVTVGRELIELGDDLAKATGEGVTRGGREAVDELIPEFDTSRGASGVDVPTERLCDARGRFVADPANPPSPYKFTDAQRRAAWKRLAEDPNSGLTAAERAQIRERGYRGPQRVNEYGELETMELSHEPVPLREGGTNVVPRWPADHAAVDPHRRLKKR